MSVTVEQFVERLWGIRPGHRSPKGAPVEPAAEDQPLGEGVATWLDRMWGIRFPQREQRAA